MKNYRNTKIATKASTPWWGRSVMWCTTAVLTTTTVGGMLYTRESPPESVSSRIIRVYATLHRHQLLLVYLEATHTETSQECRFGTHKKEELWLNKTCEVRGRLNFGSCWSNTWKANIQDQHGGGGCPPGPGFLAPRDNVRAFSASHWE